MSIVKEAFEFLQKNGVISREALPLALRAAGLNPSEERLALLPASLKELDFVVFDALVKELDDRQECQAALADAFRAFDKDMNKTVTVAELRHLLCALGEKLTEDEFLTLIDGFDNNGVIHYEPLLQKMLAPFTSHGRVEDFA